MYNFNYGFSAPNNAPNNYAHNPYLLLRVQTVQDILSGCDYPIWKQQKLENASASPILDPDCFFKKEADFYEEESSGADYQTTEVSSLSMSPSRECIYSNFSEILTPSDQSPMGFDRKTSLCDAVKEENEEIQEEIRTHDQLLKAIDVKLCSENPHLLAAIEKVLEGNVTNVADMTGLSKIEEAVVRGILEKKDFGNQNKKQKGKKREEEKQKFFFKGVLKYTESKFFGIDTNQKKRMKKKQLKKEDYYDYYWGEIAKDQNVDLSNFFHPNKKISGKTNTQISSAQNPGLKSLNTTYIDLILSSDKFRNDTIDYLETVFLKESRTSRTQKIYKLISKLNSIASAVCEKNANLPIHQQIEAVSTKIYDYLVVNPKSKLPWGDNELKEARDFAYGTIIKFSAKNTK